MLATVQKSINLIFTVSKRTIPYLDYAIASHLGLSFDPKMISINVVCLDRESVLVVRNRHPKTEQVVFAEEASGSLGHGLALNVALNLFKTSSINIVSDTDVAILQSGWDSYLQDLFNIEKYDILGTQYSALGSLTAGNSRRQQYKGKPTFTWIAFSHRVDLEGLDLRPAKGLYLPIKSRDESEVYGLPIGFELLADVGWQLPQHIRKRNYSYKVLEIITNDDPRCCVLKTLPTYHDEFHFRGLPWLVHQRGSGRHHFRIDPVSRRFYDAVDHFLNAPAWSVKPSFVQIFSQTPLVLMDKLKMIWRDFRS